MKLYFQIFIGGSIASITCNMQETGVGIMEKIANAIVREMEKEKLLDMK